MSLWDNIGSRIVAILTDALGNAFGTLSNPVRTDPTGTTTQPVSVVSGTINATINNLDVTDRSGRLVGHVTVDSAPTTAVTNASLSNLDVALSTRLKPADTLTGVTTVGAVTGITNALPAGSNLLGKVGIDQTTPGTTNLVQVGGSLPAGSNVIGHVIVDTAPSTAVTNAGLSNIDVALSTRLKPADTLAGVTTVGAVTSITNALPAGSNVIGHVIVDTAPSTAITAASLPLPTGAATDASLTTLDTDLKATQPRKIQAVVSDTDASYTAAATSDLTQTSAGRLRVDIEATAREYDSLTAVYTSDRMARRLQEVLALEAYEASFRNLMVSESATSQRMGYEVR